MNILFKIFGIDKPFKDFDSNIKNYGIALASKILIKSLGLKTSTNLKDFPKKGPVLVYADHPTGIDPFLLFSVLNSNNVEFLGDIYHKSKGKNLTKYIAPTAPSDFWGSFLRRRPTNWPGFLYMRAKYPTVSVSVARKINSKAIDQIVKNLSQGHLSLVFPSGGEYEFLPWKKGISIILQKLFKSKVNFCLYRIKFKKHSEARLFCHFALGKKFFSGIEVIGYPVDLSAGLLKLPPKLLVSKLKSL